MAMDARTNKKMAVGQAAYEMLGKTSDLIRVVRPLAEGVISDYEVTEEMLKDFFKKVCSNKFFKPRVCVCVPSAITEVESRAVIDTVMSSGARNVFLIEEPVAAAIGAGIDITIHGHRHSGYRGRHQRYCHPFPERHCVQDQPEGGGKHL